MSAHSGSDEHFDSWHFEGGTLVLSYSYGANEVVSPRVDTRGSDVVVGLNRDVGDGDTPAIALSGEARFGIVMGPTTVRNADGEKLDYPNG